MLTLALKVLADDILKYLIFYLKKGFDISWKLSPLSSFFSWENTKNIYFSSSLWHFMEIVSFVKLYFLGKYEKYHLYLIFSKCPQSGNGKILSYQQIVIQIWRQMPE